MAESLNTEPRQMWADLSLDPNPAGENDHKDTAANYSPLVLAYMGDAVWELIVRRKIVREGNRQVNRMHHDAVRYVKAEAQAKLIRLIEPELTAREAGVYRRGRNAHSNTMAKNASMIDYRMATGFEALVGYLWLNGEEARLMSLLRLAVGRLEGKIAPADHDRSAEKTAPAEGEGSAEKTVPEETEEMSAPEIPAEKDQKDE